MGKNSTCITDLEQKKAAVHELLSGLERVLVALSGGVDSAVLLRLAVDCLGPGQVCAATIHSDTIAAAELVLAKRIAGLCGVTHQIITVDELSIPEYAANPVNRCYYCQRHRFRLLLQKAAADGCRAVLDGSNLSDLGDYRPGQKALKELGIRSPLKECAFTKEDIRRLAKSFGLPNWNQPANACLASRLPYGTPVTKDALTKIAAGEALLQAAGFAQCRLRHHGELARLEVSPAEFSRLLDIHLRERLIADVKNLGYAYVALDLQGYRTGSLNEAIADK